MTEVDTLEKTVALMKQHKVIAPILAKLSAELSPDLSYHNAAHTEEVMREALFFAIKDGLGPRDIELIAIAAAFHDAGFLSKNTENEALGAKLAVAAMKEAGSYAEEEMKLVNGMILDTVVRSTPHGLKQIPTTRLSPYLLDGDMGNLGREDFFEKGENVFKELGISSRKSFLKASLGMVEAHQWYSPAARNLREAQKQKNIEILKAKIKN